MSIPGPPKTDSLTPEVEDEMAAGILRIAEEEPESRRNVNTMFKPSWTMFAILVVCAYSSVHLFFDVSRWYPGLKSCFWMPKDVYKSSPKQVRYNFATNQVTPVMSRARYDLFEIVPPPKINIGISNTSSDEEDLPSLKTIDHGRSYADDTPEMPRPRKNKKKSPLSSTSSSSLASDNEDGGSPAMLRSRNTLWEVAPPPKIDIYNSPKPSDDVNDDLPPVKIVIRNKKSQSNDGDEVKFSRMRINLHSETKRHRKRGYTRSQSDSVELYGCESDPCVFQISSGEEGSENVVMEIRHYKKDIDKKACAVRRKLGTSKQRFQFPDFDVDIHGYCGFSQVIELESVEVKDKANEMKAAAPTLALILK